MLLCLLCLISFNKLAFHDVDILACKLRSFEYLQIFYRLDEVSIALSGQAELFLDFHFVSSVEAGKGDELILVTYFAHYFGLVGF